MNDFNLKKNKKSGTCEETPDLFKPIIHFRVLVLNFRNKEKEQFLKSFGRFCGLNRKKYITEIM